MTLAFLIPIPGTRSMPTNQQLIDQWRQIEEQIKGGGVNVTIEHFDGKLWDLPPLHWARYPAGLMVACENGHATNVETWDIDASGKVTPSILCLTPMNEGSECGWHVFATLAEYQP